MMKTMIMKFYRSVVDLFCRKMTLKIHMSNGSVIRLTHVKECNFTLGGEKPSYSLEWTHAVFRTLLVIKPSEIVAVEYEG